MITADMPDSEKKAQAICDELGINYAWPGQSSLRVKMSDRCGTAVEALEHYRNVMRIYKK